MFKHLFLVGVLLCSYYNSIGQSDRKITCPDSCGKNNQNGNLLENVKPGINKKTLTCKLTTPELQKRKSGILASLRIKIIKRKELTDGYAYLFSASDGNIDEITDFIKTERLCCDFFTFNATIQGDDLWLSITGEEGAKEFITTELEL